MDAGCEDIASQLVNFEGLLQDHYPNAKKVDGLEVVMGGGRRHFLPKGVAYNSPDASSDIEGDRNDGRDLISEWQEQYPQGSYVYDQSVFDAIGPEYTERVFGLLNESHMKYEAGRGNDIAGGSP